MGLPSPHSLGSWKARCRGDAELSPSSLLLDAVERKGVKGLLLVGREKVPHGLGLTGDCGGDTADGAGNLRRPAT